MKISVIICTCNPNRQRLHRTLAGLDNQTLPVSEFEVVLIDNASEPPLDRPGLGFESLPLRIELETKRGLTPARLSGIDQAKNPILVFVDDDNVLASNFLSTVQSTFANDPQLAAAGGPIAPEFESSPPEWLTEFHSLLAVRDFGSKPQYVQGHATCPWPDIAPVGAGMCVVSRAAQIYAEEIKESADRIGLDRKGGQLTSGGDNDMVFTVLHRGGKIAYLPELKLTHLIPESRIQPDYLARLNQAIQRSWIKVLDLHGNCSWSAIPRWTVPLRIIRAWLVYRAWVSTPNYIRWRGACGHFQGRADIR